MWSLFLSYFFGSNDWWLILTWIKGLEETVAVALIWLYINSTLNHSQMRNFPSTGIYIYIYITAFVTMVTVIMVNIRCYENNYIFFSVFFRFVKTWTLLHKGPSGSPQPVRFKPKWGDTDTWKHCLPSQLQPFNNWERHMPPEAVGSSEFHRLHSTHLFSLWKQHFLQWDQQLGHWFW